MDKGEFAVGAVEQGLLVPFENALAAAEPELAVIVFDDL